MPGTQLEHQYALPFRQKLRHFMVERLLGPGGFGLTYLALDTKLDRQVAIKELLPLDFAFRGDDKRTVYPRSPTHAKNFEWALRRFLEEGQTLARLHHPAILPIYDFFEENGTAYLITAYIQGETFEQQLRRRKHIDEAELRQFTLTVLGALQLVHNQFVQRDAKTGNVLLHRDIKTENILMDSVRKNTPVLIDFGNARIASEEKTKSLTAVLTPGYAPFEQYTTNGRQGPWTDLYALGAVLFRAVTGAPPENSADRTDVDTVPILADNPPRGYSRDFLATIDKALRMRREERWQNCQEWLDALGVRPPLPPPPPPGPGWLRRYWLMLAGLLVVAAITGIVFMVLSRGDFSTKSDSPASPTPVPDPARVIETTPKPVVTPTTPTPAPSIPTPTRTPSTPTPTPSTPSLSPEDTISDAQKVDTDIKNNSQKLLVPVSMMTVPDSERTQTGATSIRKIYVSKFPIRERDYNWVMHGQYDSSSNSNADKPKVNITWTQANDFCNEVNKSAENYHLHYRLPKDYEWSYAVGGLSAELNQPHFNRTPMGRKGDVPDVCPWGTLSDPLPAVIQNNNSGVLAAGSIGPTKSGLYDMGGNVRQWCYDSANGDDRYTITATAHVVRGSSWRTVQDPTKRLSSYREICQASDSGDDLGFRCVVEIIPTQ